MKDYQEAIGVDIGGSHITAARINLTSMEVNEGTVHRSSVNSLADQETIIQSWVDCLLEVMGQNEGHLPVGIAMPAPFDYENGISLILEQGKFRALYQSNVKIPLAEKLGLPPSSIRFINDAAAFLEGESYAEAAKPYSRLMGITLGSGLGSAFKLGKEAEDAALWEAPFKDSTAESYLGTDWFIRWAKAQLGLKISGVKDLVDLVGEKMKVKEAFETFGLNFGEFLLPYLKMHQIEAIILGGNISRSSGLFLPYTREYLEKNEAPVPFLISKSGENSALIGAVSSFHQTP